MTRQSPRIRRLRTDHKSMQQLKSESTIVDFVARGDPPDSYLIKFHGRGLFRPDGSSQIMVSNEHHVGITLGASYPRLMPELAWKTPLFHPNVSGSGVVCLGGYGTYWVPSLNLDELCEMLWDMIRYANYDVDSPYNRDAANWARTQGEYRFPVDVRPIRDRVAAGQREGYHPGGNHSPAGAVSGGDDIFFLDDNEEVVDAEVVQDDDPDILIIE